MRRKVREEAPMERSCISKASKTRSGRCGRSNPVEWHVTLRAKRAKKGRSLGAR